MGRNRNDLVAFTQEQLLAYLQRRYGVVTLREVRALGESSESSLKGYGYGCPLKVTFETDERIVEQVFRTMTPDPFGHDRRADRVADMQFSFEVFSSVPQHIKAIDAGVIDEKGTLISMPCGEPFLVTEYVEGTLYARDLERLASHETAREPALARALALARYLIELHRVPATTMAYRRCLRDLVGSGEGIFGLCEAYSSDDEVAPPARLEAIEAKAIRWRWKLRHETHHSRRTHGDFHPFNILFREGTDFTVLDCSRGGAGDPADDVSCLSINYLFFALLHNDLSFKGPYRELWNQFWTGYLDESGDPQIVTRVAPFFAWRALVLACPLWYPHIAPTIRDRILRFAERLLDGVSFSPDTVDTVVS